MVRLRSLPRYQPGSTRLLGKPMDFGDAESLVSMHEEIFLKEVYRFESGDKAPYIIDGGANIGLSVIYFKQLYPKARIVAFEPDPQLFKILQNNMKSFGHGDVTVLCKALWSSATTLNFFIEGADAGRISRSDDQRSLAVPTVRLREFLDAPVAFLKLDIEGAETEVLRDCADLLGNVERVFVEYHSFAKEKQELPSLVSVLANAGFRLHIHPSLVSQWPFVSRKVCHNMDSQLNIFAFRS
jgi:FkbM family methyltransferase